jgi:hypothetical protein
LVAAASRTTGLSVPAPPPPVISPAFSSGAHFELPLAPRLTAWTYERTRPGPHSLDLLAGAMVATLIAWMSL